MGDSSENAVPDLDLRSFRLQLTPRMSLGQVARGAQVHRSLLSRIETGEREITAACARRPPSEGDNLYLSMQTWRPATSRSRRSARRPNLPRLA